MLRPYTGSAAARPQRQSGSTPTELQSGPPRKAAPTRDSGLLSCRLLAVSFRAVLPGRSYFHSTVHALVPARDWDSAHSLPRCADDRQEIPMKTGALLARVASVAILLFAFGFAIFRASVQ